MRKKYISLLTSLLIILVVYSQAQKASDYRFNTNGFVENKGQIVDQNYRSNPAVKYLYNGSGINVQLRQTGFSYDTYTEDLKSSSDSSNLFNRFNKSDKFHMQPEITRHYQKGLMLNCWVATIQLL